MAGSECSQSKGVAYRRKRSSWVRRSSAAWHDGPRLTQWWMTVAASMEEAAREKSREGGDGG